jgi:hypothetical protein
MAVHLPPCSPGMPDLVVAVVDTGCDLTHPDLKANIWVNPREIPGNNKDDDGNGALPARQCTGWGPGTAVRLTCRAVPGTWSRPAKAARGVSSGRSHVCVHAFCYIKTCIH